MKFNEIHEILMLRLEKCLGLTVNQLLNEYLKLIILQILFLILCMLSERRVLSERALIHFSLVLSWLQQILQYSRKGVSVNFLWFFLSDNFLADTINVNRSFTNVNNNILRDLYIYIMVWTFSNKQPSETLLLVLFHELVLTSNKPNSK